MGPMPWETPAVERRTLTLLKVGAYVAQSIEVDEDVMRGQLVHRIEAHVLAEKLAADSYSTTVTIPFPESPWQHFKAEHAGSWWLRWLVNRWPVRFDQHARKVTVEVDRFVTYPEADVVTHPLGRPVVFEHVVQRTPREV